MRDDLDSSGDPDCGTDARPRPHRAGLPGWIGSALRSVSDILVPPLCTACRAPLADHDALCPECWRGIDFIRAPLCDRLGLPLPFDTGGTMVSAAAVADPPAYDRARAVARFDGTMRRLVHDLKFHDRHDTLALLARLMTHAGADLLRDADALVPVPLNRWRLLSRRFNQAALLASAVAGLTSVPYRPTALARTRHTPRQVDLTREQRRTNVAGAFTVPPRHRREVEDHAIVVVDDVITTGETAEACARALKRAGARRVDVLALGLVSDRARVTT